MRAYTATEPQSCSKTTEPTEIRIPRKWAPWSPYGTASGRYTVVAHRIPRRAVRYGLQGHYGEPHAKTGTSRAGSFDQDRDYSGKLPPYAWPGGYDIRYYTPSGGTLCAYCANAEDRDGSLPIGTRGDVHWEGPTESCDGCNAELPSEYGDPWADDDDQADAYLYPSDRRAGLTDDH